MLRIEELSVRSERHRKALSMSRRIVQCWLAAEMASSVIDLTRDSECAVMENDGGANAMTFQQLYEAINSLPMDERLRLVERVVHDVAESSKETEPEMIERSSPLDGLFFDIPELVDEVCAAAYQHRATRRLRTRDR